MLQKIRDRISGWIAGVVIAVVAGAFIFFGVEYYFDAGSGGNNTAAKVNGESISKEELNHAFSQLQRQVLAETHGQPLTPNTQQQLKNYALQSLISQIALETTLEREGYRVGLTQAKLMIEQMPEFQARGQFSESKFMAMIYANNVSPEIFFQRVQSRWVVQQALDGMVNSAFALPNEVERYYGLSNQSRSFGYMIVPANTFAAKIKVASADIKKYYQDHAQEYQTPATVSVSYITLSPTNIEKTIHITDADAKAYYDTHQANYQGHAFDKIKENLIKLLTHQRANEILSHDTNQLSNLTYTNPSSLTVASKALNLPIQTSSMLTQQGEKTGLFSNPKILTAIFSDSVFKAGNNSNPIGLADGSQVVLRIAKKNNSKPIPLKNVQAAIKQKLIQQQAFAQAGVLAYELQTKIAAGANPDALAKQHGFIWKMVSDLQEHAKTETPAGIVSAAFAIPQGAKAVADGADQYAVINVTDVKVADTKNISAESQKALSAKISTLWGQLMQHCFAGSVMARAKIEVKR